MTHRIELGKTYVTLNGDWVTIVSRSCMAADAAYPFTGNNDIRYRNDGKCGVSSWDLVLEVPADQITIRKVEELLEKLSGDFSLKELVQLQTQATLLLGGVKNMTKQTYR